MKRFAPIMLALLIVLAIVCAIGYLTVPMSDTTGGTYDVLLVLGVPTNPDGTLSEAECARVDEAVREYRLGKAPVIVFSGGAAANRFVEAHAMALAAIAQGVPQADVFEEGNSLDTKQNIENSQRLMRAHAWQRVEVISTRPHLHRAAVLLGNTHLQWSTHACAESEGGWRRVGVVMEEAVATTMLRVFGLRVVPWIHAVARTQHVVGHAASSR